MQKSLNYMLNRTLLTFFIFLLTACIAEQNYRGVPNPQWEELTAEQKQLVVDQAYEKEFNYSQISKTINKNK